jgi:hypothetical protein
MAGKNGSNVQQLSGFNRDQTGMQIMQDEPLSFLKYRVTNPATDSDYPVLAVAADRSAVVLLGNYSLSFAFAVSAQVDGWLASDYAPAPTAAPAPAPSDDQLLFDLTSVREQVEIAFAGRVRAGQVTYDKQLSPTGFTVSLHSERDGDTDLEYLIEGFGSYVRLDRAASDSLPVTLAERTMLDGCVSIFAELAARCGELLREPPPRGKPGRRPRAGG